MNAIKPFILSKISFFKPYFAEFYNNIKIALSDFFSDKWALAILAIFSALYLPHVFIMVEDLGLIEGYEVDPGSCIQAIEALLKSYNMNLGYHSRYYGWTYFALNFLVLFPIKIFCLLFKIESKFWLYFAIKFLLFLIGLFSAVIFYEVVKKIFSRSYLAFIATLFYVTAIACYKFFYYIHPETCGTLFLFLGIFGLLRFIEDPKNDKIYFSSLAFLVLASLSKQIFFFMSLPVLILFLHFRCVREGEKYYKFLVSKLFLKTLFATVAIALTLLFVIHPFFFIRFSETISYTRDFSIFFSSNYSSSLSVALQIWLELCLNDSLMRMLLLSSPILLILGLITFYKKRSPKSLLYLFNLIGVWAIFFLIASINRFAFDYHYLQPIYPFVILAIISTVGFIQNTPNFVKIPSNIVFAYIIILNLGLSFYTALPVIFDRFNYQDSLSYKTYVYIKTNLTKEDKFAHDHLIGVPDEFGKTACHYWRGCGSDYIEKYSPTYVFLNEDYTLCGKNYPETERMKKYIKDNNMKLVSKISGKIFEISTRCSLESDAEKTRIDSKLIPESKIATISIYKK